jgi:hypothetical protein
MVLWPSVWRVRILGSRETCSHSVQSTHSPLDPTLQNMRLVALVSRPPPIAPFIPHQQGNDCLDEIDC